MFWCSSCGARLTPALIALPLPPTAPQASERDPATGLAPSTIPRGHYAIELQPWGAPFAPRADQADPRPAQPRDAVKIHHGVVVESAGPVNTVVIHPDDAPDLTPVADARASTGCCGPCGDWGLNLACACGAAVATLAADCMAPRELHLDPLRTYASEHQ